MEEYRIQNTGDRNKKLRVIRKTVNWSVMDFLVTCKTVTVWTVTAGV